MITVNEAQKLISDRVVLKKIIESELLHSAGFYLSEDLISPVDHPLFNQSAVDGYAFRYEDIYDGSNIELNVIGELKAGDTHNVSVSKNECVRIFTGACVTPDTDTVIMQEDVNRTGDKIFLKKPISKGSNIRYRGEQVKSGDIALRKGELLNPSAIGFLASLGFKKVRVHDNLSVGIIITGNEFTEKVDKIEQGKIFESNGIMLKCLLSETGIEAEYELCKDSADKLKAMIQNKIHICDLLIITGGVSVGDYDFTKTVLESLEFEIAFHKVSQKPGKPFLFAVKNGKALFGLPGNPRAVIVCFYEYILPYIKESMGSASPYMPEIHIRLSHGYTKKNERAFFLAARIENGEAVILEKQDSHMLQSFSRADILLILDEGAKKYVSGDIVKAHLLR